VKNPDLNPADC